MASNNVSEDKKLLDLFDEGFSLFISLQSCDEPTNSLNIQSKIKHAMKIFEQVTRLTSIAGIFSSNESVEEISTENLRLFLLPAILGTLALTLTLPNRMEVVDTSDIYFRDFLQRCADYGVCDVDIPPPASLDPQELERAFSTTQPCMFDLFGAAKTRAAKIQRYHEEKALQAELNSLVKVISLPDVEEEVKRDYYMKLIKSYVTKAEEELDCLQSEKRILTHMQNVKKDEETNGEEHKKRPKHYKPQPLKPVIITKDEVQKAVFGVGYPSIPTMTVQEFYDKRVRDGDFPDPSKTASRSLQNMDYTDDVKETAEEEDKMERDDEELLERQRDMDEFKDNHKRGEGNRYNRS